MWVYLETIDCLLIGLQEVGDEAQVFLCEIFVLPARLLFFMPISFLIDACVMSYAVALTFELDLHSIAFEISDYRLPPGRQVQVMFHPFCVFVVKTYASFTDKIEGLSTQ